MDRPAGERTQRSSPVRRAAICGASEESTLTEIERESLIQSRQNGPNVLTCLPFLSVPSSESRVPFLSVHQQLTLIAQSDHQ